MAERYQITGELGHGGTARVLRATDAATGGEVALKQLILPKDPAHHESAIARFRGEFYTLAELKHPRVIAVFDYGLAADGVPFYTMELLDGGDLREQLPVPWRTACRWVFDVCSSLALLHSRRLLHRDISPRNIRCTRDGRAKLIDFGAMTPMVAGGAPVVGTPAYIAPESLYGSALDARTDLFSLGVTLYNALTGSLPYPGRTFAQVRDAWQDEPLPPSTRAPGIPAELDDLVLAMLCVEPSRRPQSAFDVMQRLAAVAGFEIHESDAVTRSYLATPSLVGRDDVLLRMREALESAGGGQGRGVLIRGEHGMGRSRVLDACALLAKTLGAVVVRANANGDQRPFALAFALAQHVAEARTKLTEEPRFRELLALGDSSAELLGPKATPAEIQARMCELVLESCKERPLLIAVDDVHSIDEPSAAVLVSLIGEAERQKLCLVLTADANAPDSVRALRMLAVRCEQVALRALTREQTRELMVSTFGDVPNIGQLSREIDQVAHGNPGEALDLAQHLIDRQFVRYAAGNWSLPSELPPSAVPRSALDAVRERVQGLSPAARWFAQAHALSHAGLFERSTYHRLQSGFSEAAAETALNELLTKQAVSSDGHHYRLINRLWTTAILEVSSEAEQRVIHNALADLHQSKAGGQWIHHLFCAGRDEGGLNGMIAHNLAFVESTREADVEEILLLAPHYARAVQTAERLGRGPKVINNLWRFQVAGAATALDTAGYAHAAPKWLAQLKHDSGLEFWLADTQPGAANDRLMRALQVAHANYEACPESERVYTIEEALRLLVEYVVCSIPVAVRGMDYALLESLAPLLAPFAPLSPLLHAIWQNALATFESSCRGQYFQARARWIDVLERLATAQGAEFRHVEQVRHAIQFGLGTVEAMFGMPSAEERVARVEGNPFQQVGVLLLRKIVRLEQGDWKEAARLDRLADELALRTRAPSMFFVHLLVELKTYAQARDLAGIKRVVERIEPLALRFVGWGSHLITARALFELVRGDFSAAIQGFEVAIAETEPDASGRSRNLSGWVQAQTGLAEALLLTEQLAETRDRARAALERCKQLEIVSVTDGLLRAWAVAEAKLGNFESALAAIQKLIEQQRELGIAGLKLGLSYETCARIAIVSGDEDAFDRFARLTAREYRHGAGCPLGARYDALLNEARRRGFDPSPQIGSLDPPSLLR